jgi:hypothetical protein
MNKSVLDYYLLPRVDILWEKLRLLPDNGVVLDLYRFENLNFFMRFAQRTRVATELAARLSSPSF